MEWGAQNSWGGKAKTAPKEQETTHKQSHRRTVALKELSLNYQYRRAFSELQLLDSLNLEDLKDGHCYNFITGGDVDAMSYLRLILRHKKRLDHVLASTWCMNGEDIMQFRQWVENGIIGSLDIYVGEIFPSQYRIEWNMLNELYNDLQCGRLAYFKNHSKIFAGCSGDFYFGVQSSANINTNPRTENGCIIIDKGIYDFYKEYFNGIKSF